MRQRFLRDAQPGDYLDDVYIITQKQLATTSTNKTYIKAFVSDRSHQVTARIWNASRQTFELLPDSGFVRLRGRVENYQGNLQLIIEDLRPVALGEFDVADLIPHTTRDVPQMLHRLLTLCHSIHNADLKSLIQAYLDDQDLMDRLARSPAAQSFHHAFLGGLLEHTLNAMDVADAIVKFYPGLSRDLLLAGILLHDIAKTWELSYDCAFGYTDGGQLVGHIVKSAIWVEEKAREAAAKTGKKIPQELIDLLQHIIISHHGVPEFGAVKVPATPEAIAVHFIENLDARMMMSLAVTRGELAASAAGRWTEYQKALGTRLYRPDVTAPDFHPEQSSAAPAETSSSPQGPAAPPAQTRPPTIKMNVTNPLFESLPHPRKQ